MDAPEKMKEIIVSLMFRDSYWGYLFGHIRRQATQHMFPMFVGILHTGETILGYDCESVENTDTKTLLYILEHEGVHLLNKHLSRILKIIADDPDDSQDRREFLNTVWNIASDIATNQQMGMPKTLTVNNQPFKPVFPENYKLPGGKAAEWYFWKLMNEHKDEMQKLHQAMKGQKIIIVQGEGQGEGSGQGQGDSKDGKEICYQFIDDHSEWIKDLDKVPDVHTLSRKVEQQIANAVIQAAREVKKRGNLPAYISELISELLEPPKLPYYELIKKLVKGSHLAKWVRSWARINRKRVYMFQLDEQGSLDPELCPFPGRKRDFSFRIGLMLDTSGSMAIEDIMEGLSGIKNIIEHDRNCFTTVIEVDAAIQKEYSVKKLSDIQFNIKGRGGTTLYPALERFKELNVDVVLGFTDGFCDNLNEYTKKDMPKKIIWVITPRGSAEMLNRTGYVVWVDKNGNNM